MLIRHLLLVLLFMFGKIAFCQSTAKATASATIVSPFGVTTDLESDFVSVSIINETPEIRLIEIGTGRMNTKHEAEAIIFMVVNNKYDYNISFPASSFFINRDNGGIMKIHALNAATSSVSNNVDKITVGATLAINAEQTPGDYNTTSAFTVVVNYN